MSNWTLPLPFNWGVRGGWCTRDRIGGVNYSTNGLRQALRIQRKTKSLHPSDSQVVTYSLIIERNRELSGWAHEEWQVEITADYTPKFRVRKHIYRYHGLQSLWLKDTEAVWLDSNKFPERKPQPLNPWEEELES
jgi:hypothetical protein